jgi:uncharacterized protein YidB (DUF937 family)
VEINDIVEQVKGVGGDPKNVVAAVSKMVSEAGGVDAVVGKLRDGGMGEHASSWVGKGQNRTADPKDVSRALGRERVRKVAKDAGVSEDEAERGVASALPGLIDKLTPEGNMPSDGGSGGLSQLLSNLR